MTISVVGTPAFGSNTTSFNLSWASGHQADDVAILAVETANQTVSTPSGWTLIGSTGQGTAGLSNAVALHMFWRRATSSSMAAVTVPDAGDHQSAVLVTYRGCVNTDEPYDTTVGAVFANKTTGSSTTTWAAQNATLNDSWPVWFASNDSDSSTVRWTSASNTVFGNVGSSPSTITAATASGNGGQTMGLWNVPSGGSPTPLSAGQSTGVTTATMSVSEIDCVCTLILIEARIVTKNGTDTGAGTDTATAALVGTQTDAGAGTDTATSIRVAPLADAGAGTDTATGSLAGTQADTAAGSDVAAGNLAGTQGESGSSVDTAGIRLGDTDSGLGSDTAYVSQAQSDAGSGADQASISLSISGDSGSGTDDLAAVGVYGAADSGAAVESAFVTLFVDESALAAESEFVAAGGSEFFSSDDGIGSDSASVDALLTQNDSAAGVETASVDNSAADATAGQDSAAVIISGANDSASGIDAGSIVAGIPAADTGSATESAWVVVHVLDAGSGADAAGVVIQQSDSGSATEQAGSPDAVQSQSDTATAVDEAFISITVADTASAVEAQARSIIGALIGVPRVFWVDPESRTTTVPRENRTTATGPETRLTMVGRENRTLKQSEEDRTTSIST